MARRFKKGQLVLLKSSKLGKLQPRVEPEPFVFVRYVSTGRAEIHLQGSPGRTRTVHVQMLTLYDP